MKKNKKLVPKRRLKKFKNKYNLVEVKDEFNFIKNYSYSRNDEGKGEYHHIHYGDIHSKYSVYLDNSVNIPTIKNKKTHTELIYGDIIVADASEDYKDLGKAVILLDKGKRKNIAGLHTFSLRTRGQINPLYFVYYSKTNQYKKYMSKVGTGTSVYGITKNSLESMKLVIPPIEEQEMIGAFLKEIDEMIQLQQSKINKVQDIKFAYLSDMFPKEGEKYPKKRFEGFTEPWKKCRLGELSDISTGKLDANAMITNGRYDFYTSGIKKYKIDIPAFEGPAITIAGNGATVGYMHLADGKFNAYQRTYVLQNFKAIREFIYLEIENKLPQKINQEARMGNIPYIVMDMLTDLEIVLPQIDEQTKIGNFFKNLDAQIALEEKKLNKLEQLKQAYLNELFV